MVKKCKEGDWGSVLETLSILTIPHDNADHDDPTHQGTRGNYSKRNSNSNSNKKKEFHRILAAVHEMAILELADASEMDLAFATLKVCREFLNAGCDDDDNEGLDHHAADNNIDSSSKSLPLLGWTDRGSLSRSVERRLHEIQALRSVRAVAAEMNLAGNGITTTFATGSAAGMTDIHSLVPPDYYGPNNVTKEQRRIDIAKRLGEAIPIIPSYRLVSLLQQAIKWQVHTGEMPMVQEIFGADEIEGMDDVSKEKEEEEQDDRKKRKKAKRMKRFDLVLGNVSVENATSDVLSGGDYNKGTPSQSMHENIPSFPYSTLKFGKKSFVSSCLFYTDSSVNQTSLITGTSDGFIEIWDEETRFTKLRMDLDYQKKGEIMCHDDDEAVDDNGEGMRMPPSILAMAINAEGTIMASGDSRGTIVVWNVQTGQSLVELERVHSGAITCLEFSRDGSKILSASQDGVCREFGLRTKRMLKEFRGHTSFVNCCHYVVPTKSSINDELLIVTASADSTVRIWCGRAAEEKYALNPVNAVAVGQNVLVSRQSIACDGSSGSSDLGQNIHTVIPLHTPPNTLIIIPRGKKAFLVTLSGLLLRTFELDMDTTVDDKKELESMSVFVSGTVSPSNKWLYLATGNGICLCYDVGTGIIQRRIADFGKESTGGKSDCEISNVAHHPLKGILAAYSSSSSQKKGILTLWK